MLPVCLGNATRLCDLLTDKTKEYEAVLRLGVTTDTQDMTGTVLSETPVTASEDDIINIMSTFRGKVMQIPPMYSALKVDGRKLVDLAREGIEVERKAREIEIFSLDILEVKLPLVRFRVNCSKGTYIRTLCQDIGEKAGCGGAMESLLRTRVDRFEVKDALTLDQIEKVRDEQKIDEILYSVDDVFLHLTAVTVKNEYRKVIDNGNSLYPKMYAPRVDFFSDENKTPTQIRVYNEDGIFYGIYVYDPERRRMKPYKMFLDKEALKEKYGKEYF